MRQRRGLLDLDDPLLAQVFRHLDPFPSVANLALTCRRCNGIATDKGRWLVVSAGGAVDAAGTPSGRAGPAFRSLAAAVAASRPGDTIWLAPGARHELDAAVRIRWPLQVRGGAGATLVSAHGEAALDVAASAKVTGIAIESRLGPCILHRRGTLRIESCVLTCLNGGLCHLLAPVVTCAVSGAAGQQQQQLLLLEQQQEQEQQQQQQVQVQQPQVQVQQQQVQQQQRERPQDPAAGEDSDRSKGQQRLKEQLQGCEQPQRHDPPGAGGPDAADAPAPGRLAVADTRLIGSSGVGVLCAGTGELRAVRVIQGAGAAWVYLSVDSSKPGSFPPGARPLPRLFSAPAAAAAAATGSPRTPAPLGGSRACAPPAAPMPAPLEPAAATAAAAVAQAQARINALLRGAAITPALLLARLRQRPGA
ncbi:hypothetical protein Rsub_00348 [Raphidocelis subcapitata]|uniref:F-box domain-containing protein n=1 Tax=Raphidocelis subcapitata TaxID=307507 RepID=A0A2V0NRS3_9CHLO|nr:hypothetical protein Rsub_00348 [Raphidocelis subcapitata]|eukprot:GBF87637.1 hypothetical protein Rsub_00348 [Raphidocelis subcapitata]